MPGELWSRVRNYLYDKGIATAERANCPVISIGNLTWGGTGKTALTAFIGSFLIERGCRLAIVSRGYRRKTRGLHLVSDGNTILSNSSDGGDEPYLLARKLPQAIVVVAEKRAEAFRYLEKYQPSMILMDDAFQHRQAARDLDLVVIDASDDLTAQRVIPFGKLREGLASLQRASAVVLMHTSEANPKTVQWLEDHFSKPVFPANYKPLRLEEVEEKRVAAFCGLGAPRHFFRLLRECGADIVLAKTFKDHHSYTKAEILRLQRQAREASAEMLVTTEKDRVKINPSWIEMPYNILRVELELENPKQFCTWLCESCVIR